jgi:hypothetical protein
VTLADSESVLELFTVSRKRTFDDSESPSLGCFGRLYGLKLRQGERLTTTQIEHNLESMWSGGTAPSQG